MYRVIARFFLGFCALLFISSCANGTPSLEEKYEKLKNMKVTIPSQMDFMINGRDTLITDLQNKRMKCVMYIDTAHCSSCSLDRLLDWKPLIKEYSKNKDFAFYFIFEPQKGEREKMRAVSEYLGIDYPIVLDEQRTFHKKIRK